jgi:hypothetical protein
MLRPHQLKSFLLCDYNASILITYTYTETTSHDIVIHSHMPPETCLSEAQGVRESGERNPHV